MSTRRISTAYAVPVLIHKERITLIKRSAAVRIADTVENTSENDDKTGDSVLRDYEIFACTTVTTVV